MSEKESDGSAWVRKLGTQLLSAWFDLWEIRNKERHGKDLAEQKLKRREFLTSQLEELYSYRDHIMPADRHIYPHATAEKHVTHRPNLDGLEDWIEL